MSTSKEIDFFLSKKRKSESDSEYENKDSDRERLIAIYRENSRVLINVKKIKDFFYIIKMLDMPYFYKLKEKIYFNYDKNIKSFWTNQENKILYESKTKMIISKDAFYASHENHKPEKIKYYSDFCFPYYYFSSNKEEIFFNNMNTKVINKLKNTRQFDDYKIIKLFGPKKSGKSTIIYYYFGMRRYIPLNEMYYVEDIDNMDNFNSNDPKYIKNKDFIKKSQMDLIDVISREKNKKLNNLSEADENKRNFISTLYDENIKREEYLEANAEIPFLEKEPYKELNTFDDKDIELKKNERKYKKKIFKKEFYFTVNDTIGYFRSCYLNNTFFENDKYSKEEKIATLHFEFSALFKSYRVFKFFINKFNDNEANFKNIIDIGIFIVNFMKKYNKENIRYFIIFDEINNKQIKQLKDFELLSQDDNNCFIIEIYNNDEINDIFEKEVMKSEKKDDEKILYLKNYCEFKNEYYKSLNISNEDKEFLSQNFDNNLYYIKEFLKFKEENINNSKEMFLEKIMDDTKKDLLKNFSCKDEGKIFYRYILNKVLDNKIINKNIIRTINLDYFFIKKNEEKEKYILEALPFVKKTLSSMVLGPLKNIINEDYFFNLDEYIKGGIFESIIVEELKKLFLNNAKNQNDFQEINVKRLLDNEIYSIYDENIIVKILKSKKSFLDLKSKLSSLKFKFKDKITILRCVQNEKHYDLGIIFYNILFVFQITINKDIESLNELNQFLNIDINYIINKLEQLTNEKDIIKNVYAYLVNIDMDSIYTGIRNKEIDNYIKRNKRNNIKMQEKMKDKKIKIIYLSKNFEFFNSNFDKIIKFPMLNDQELYSITQINHYNELIRLAFKEEKINSLLKKSEKLPKFIPKGNIRFYSMHYPNLKIPENYILYIEFPSLKKELLKIQNQLYDIHLNKIKGKFSLKNNSDERVIFIYTY